MQKSLLALALILIPALLLAEAEVPADHTAAIETRQATFKEMKGAVKDVKTAMKDKDFAAAEQAAGVIANDAQLLTTLFPQDSYEGDTRAKKKIWENLEDFQARQQKLVKDANALVTATQSNDPKALKEAFKTVGKNCKGCHMKYRQVF